ncbi:class I SAM-dependent methyltransferase [Pseudonocardia acaciae]|uniref:class I SAM-dependent methyltransferase n=1 Tax=Pseudonocardia acaciae TaxID=551276 RepID=UPI0004901ACD|nr:hypothetical protein [Pseudonocardia acaciae]
MSAPTDPTLVSGPLADARDRSGRTVEEWSAAALASVDGPVVEMRGARDDRARCVTLHRGGSASAVRARADLLPVADDALAGVRVTLCLPTLEPLDAVFDELRRALRPTGTLAALVPSRPSLWELRAWSPLYAALGGRPRFRSESARDRLSWLFTAADFAVLVDARRTFWVPVPDAGHAARVVAALSPAGLWPPGLPADRVRLAGEALGRSAGAGRRLPIPVRLVVGRR